MKPRRLPPPTGPSLAAALALTTLLACTPGGADDAPKTADAVVTDVAQGLAANRPQVLWQALPESYRRDVTDLVHEAAGSHDPEVWTKTFGVLRKATRVLGDKRDLILAHPLLAPRVAEQPELRQSWDHVVGLFGTLVDSELGDPEKMRTLDVEKFLAGTGSRLLERLRAASAALGTQDDRAQRLRTIGEVKATLLESAGDTAKVRIEQPGEETVEETFVRVEGRWIPERLARSWPEKIAEARERMKAEAGDPADKAGTLMQLGMVEGVLDSLLAADTAEEFNAALGPALGMVLGMAMSHAPAPAEAPETEPAPTP
jgi:hypothetical protein